jgi:GWxTD domain-containing protein
VYKNKTRRFALLSAVLLIGLSSCNGPERLSRINLNTLYDGSLEVLYPEAFIYHSGADSSTCFFRVPSSNLLTVKNAEQFEVKLQVYFELYAGFGVKAYIDSGSISLVQNAGDSLKWLEGSFAFPMQFGSDAVLKVRYRDPNRKAESLQLLNCRKSNHRDAQSYLLTDGSGHPLFQNFLTQGGVFSITSAVDSTPMFWVRCYFHRYPFALPPFNTGADYYFNYTADSVFTIARNEIGHLKIEKYGFYFFQSDSSVKKGKTIFVFGNKFPVVSRAEELIEPTRYLTMQKEYEALRDAKDKKAAADQFWLTLAGDPDRAREAIRIYYSRVQDANVLFTSFMEGWKTDRGMIYIIFGPPRSVFRDEHVESWSYYTNPGTPELVFSFKKMGNPFTDEDYSLLRDGHFENSWFLAVEEWRQGRIVNNNE